jgi:hypothetical protein
LGRAGAPTQRGACHNPLPLLAAAAMTMGVLVRLLTGVAIAALLLGCGLGRVDRTEAVADLETLLPTIDAFRVTNFLIDERCHYIAYERGVFVTDPDSEDCILDMDGPYPRARIDDQARADIESILAESDRLGQRLHHAFVQYDADGTMIVGSFGFDWDRDFVYEPHWVELPSEDSQEVTAIDADWYEVSSSGLD